MARARQLLADVGTRSRVSIIGRASCLAVSGSGSPSRGRSIRAPRSLVCDEPTGNLDRASAESVADFLVDLHRAQQTMLVVVTHSAALAARFRRRFELNDRRLQQVS